MENKEELLKKLKEYLSKDVGDKIEKVKGGGDKEYNYLSWAWCFTEVMKIDPFFTYKVLENLEGLPYWFDEDLGYIVKTEMTILGITRTMWLPVMNANNYAMKNKPYEVQTKYKTYKVDSATMFDVNKAIMRCLVKNVAMCIGLGLYIYAGEDIPQALDDAENVEVKQPKKQVEKPQSKEDKKAEKVEATTQSFMNAIKSEGTALPKETIVSDLDLPFLMEEKQVNVLEQLQDAIADKCNKLNTNMVDMYGYYCRQFKKKSVEELNSEELMTICDKLDELMEKRGIKA